MLADSTEVTSTQSQPTSTSPDQNTLNEDQTTIPQNHSVSKKSSVIIFSIVGVFLLAVISVGAYFIINKSPVATTSISIVPPLVANSQSDFTFSETSSVATENVEPEPLVMSASVIPIDCSGITELDNYGPEMMRYQICAHPENTMTRSFAGGKSGECQFTINEENHTFLFNNGKYLYSRVDAENTLIEGKAYQNNLTYGWNDLENTYITLKTDEMTAIHSLPVIAYDNEDLYQSSCVERLVSNEELSPPDENWQDAYEYAESYNN